MREVGGTWALYPHGWPKLGVRLTGEEAAQLGESWAVAAVADSPDVTTGMRLLDAMKCHGFTFRRIAPGPDGPLEGVREFDGWRDVIYLGGFSTDCFAWREQQSSLVLPGGALVQIRIQGGALDVLIEVLGWPELPT